jgi:hypothetical protein
MVPNTQGWIVIYDVKGQCAICANVVKDGKMAACAYSRHEFGNAHNCPVYAHDWEDAK